MILFQTSESENNYCGRTINTNTPHKGEGLMHKVRLNQQEEYIIMVNGEEEF